MDQPILSALSSSAIVFPDDKAAAKAGFSEFTAEDVLNYGYYGLNHGMLIKYPAWDGSIPAKGFVRVRFTNPPISKKSGKPMRYVQPPNTEPKVYLPNCHARSWLDICTDTAVPIIITEGEKKAYSATLNLCIHTMGLGGVTSFAQRKKDQKYLLDDFEFITWTKRIVYIAYDSDIKENANVERAELVLASSLADLGADVYLVRLPSFDGKKLGLDDAIAQLGATTTLSYIDTAEPFANAKALAKFGETCWYVRKTQVYIDISTNTQLDPRKAAGSYYSNANYLKRSLDSKGNVVVKESNLFKDYNNWSARTEVEDVVSEPGKPKVTADNEYNLWTDTSVAPTEGSVEGYLNLCKYFFSDDPAMETYWHDWVATLVQTPGVKMQTAWLLYSRNTGTGKSLMARCVGSMFGRSFHEGHAEVLTDERNDWIVGKQLVLVDDLNDYVGRKDGAKIRAMITRVNVHLNPKYVQGYDVQDHTNYIITTNEEVSVKLEQTDRRFYVVNSPETRADDTLYKAAWSMFYSDSGAAALKFYYLNYKISEDFSYATRPPETSKALSEAKAASVTQQDAFAELLVGEHCALIPEGVNVLSAKDVTEFYNTQVPMKDQQASFKRCKVVRWLKVNGFRALRDYDGGFKVGYTNNGTLYFVGAGAQALLDQRPSRAECQAMYDAQLVARSALFHGACKF